jgi:hypothetical protein
VRQIQDVQHYITEPYLENLDSTLAVEILDLDQAQGPRPAE